jgi:hypothetical protein
VYVFDRLNARVQKFDAEGHFVLMFGGEVDKTDSGNICTATSGHTCGAGVEGTGSSFFTETPEAGSFIAIGPSDDVYVGDNSRIQVFEPDGTFLKSIVLSAPAAGEVIEALAVDTYALSPSFGDAYVAFFKSLAVGNKAGVRKIDSTGAVADVLEPAVNPHAIAVDPTNGDVYIASREKEISGNMEILRFNSSGNLVEQFGTPIGESTGLATNAPPACNLSGPDLVISSAVGGDSFGRIYGPAPDPAVCPPPKVPPSIDDQYATSVNSGSATVKAKINPHFWTTTTRYFVEYGTGKCSEGGCTQKKPLPPGAPLPGQAVDEDLTTAGITLAGLAPDTSYRYRFVAESEGSSPGVPTVGDEAFFHTYPATAEPPADTCPNSIFRTGASGKLPDCRAFEMVSPLESNGADVASGLIPHLVQADEAGERVIFSSKGSFGEPESAYLTTQFLATREGDGWESHSITPPRNSISLYPLGGINFQYRSLSSNLCEGWFVQDTDRALVEGAPPGVPNLYRRDLCSSGYELLTTVAPPSFGLEPLESYYYPEPQGSSADGTRTVFRADDKLTSNAAPETKGKETYQLYVSQPDGTLRLVSVLPSKTSAAGKASEDQATAGTATAVGAQGSSNLDNVSGGVSEDGSRVFWTATKSSGAVSSGNHGGGPGQLYLRDNATEAESNHQAGTGKCTQPTKACTYEVSGLIGEGAEAQFWQGNTDGTRALFSIKEQLYEFSAEEEESGELETSATLIAEGFKGFMGASKDATRAYFVSTKALDPGTGADVEGANNLYFYEEGGVFKFVAALSNLDMFGNKSNVNEPPSPVAILPFKRTARVSPDGLHAAFMSTTPPASGFDNTDQNSGQPDAEIFLYGADSGKLVCASCNASGARPAGREIANSDNGKFQLWAAANLGGWISEFQPPRNLSADGNQLFFTSYEPLLPRDTNGRADVYEWEASAGKDQCLDELGGELFLTESSGCLSLISSGQSSEDSEFFDATPQGQDVFFSTLSSLVPQDTGLLDVYDAREGGGFPAPPSPAASCEGEACQSPPAPPNEQTPSSATYNGPGNLSETKPKCPKGKVKKQGKCVKKKAKKKSKHHSKKKAKKGKGAKTNGRAGR